MRKNILTGLLCLVPFFNLVVAQHEHAAELKGIISETDDENQDQPIPYANIYWLESQKGVIGDSLGRFEIHKHKGDENLVVSAVGYRGDTILIRNQKYLNVKLEKGLHLEGVNAAAGY